MAAGIPQFAARSVRELDEETSRGYQAIVTPTVTNLTGRVPMAVESFSFERLQTLFVSNAGGRRGLRPGRRRHGFNTHAVGKWVITRVALRARSQPSL